MTVSWLKGSDLNEKSLQEIALFREAQLRPKLPDLFSVEHEQMLDEQAMDKRSYHVVIKRKDAIVGYTRLVPVPFEYSLVSDVTGVDEYRDFLEITRAVVIPQEKKLGRVLLFLQE